MFKKPIETKFGLFKEASYGESWVLQNKLSISYFDGMLAEVTLRDLDKANNKEVLINLLDKVVNHSKGKFQELSDRVFENYKDFGDAVGFEDLPEITQASVVWSHVYNLRVYIFHDYYHPEQLRVGFTFDCGWEEEHGLGILLNEKLELLEVGTQDVAF